MLASPRTSYRTRKNNTRVARPTGTNFTYREGAYGLEVYHGRTCMGTWPSVWSAQKVCVVGFLQAKTTTRETAIPVLRRVLTDKTALFLLKDNFGKALTELLTTLEQGGPLPSKDMVTGGCLPSQYCEPHRLFHRCLIPES